MPRDSFSQWNRSAGISKPLPDLTHENLPNGPALYCLPSSAGCMAMPGSLSDLGVKPIPTPPPFIRFNGRETVVLNSGTLG